VRCGVWWCVSGVWCGSLWVMPAWDVGGMAYRLLRLSAVVIAGVIAYFAALALLGFKLRDFARRTN
ncbi:hypothetical protein CS536_17600, partial [Yersinia kristensenii]